jgi:hypothetical protein
VLDAGEDIPAAVHRVAESTRLRPGESDAFLHEKSDDRPKNPPKRVGDRTIQVASGFADLETDARRQAGFRVWTQVLSGERDTERDEH